MDNLLNPIRPVTGKKIYLIGRLCSLNSWNYKEPTKTSIEARKCPKEGRHDIHFAMNWIDSKVQLIKEGQTENLVHMKMIYDLFSLLGFEGCGKKVIRACMIYACIHHTCVYFYVNTYAYPPLAMTGHMYVHRGGPTYNPVWVDAHTGFYKIIE